MISPYNIGCISVFDATQTVQCLEGNIIYEDIAKDRILETENLTDALDGDSANWLIDWAVAQIPTLLHDVTDEAAADEIIYNLMQTMRTLNGLGADAAELPAEDLVESIREFSTRFGAVNRAVLTFDEDRIRQAAEQIAGKPPLETLPYLVNLIKPPEVAPAAEAQPTSGETASASAPASVNPLAALMNAVSGAVTEMTSAKNDQAAAAPSEGLTSDLSDSASSTGTQQGLSGGSSGESESGTLKQG